MRSVAAVAKRRHCCAAQHRRHREASLCDSICCNGRRGSSRSVADIAKRSPFALLSAYRCNVRRGSNVLLQSRRQNFLRLGIWRTCCRRSRSRNTYGSVAQDRELAPSRSGSSLVSRNPEYQKPSVRAKVSALVVSRFRLHAPCRKSPPLSLKAPVMQTSTTLPAPEPKILKEA